MDFNKLSLPLGVEDVEFRIQSINKVGYATLLAYKDARVDMNRLDKVAGAINWKREHFVLNGSMYCKVSIFNENTGQWVSKEDCGTPSMTEKEKGLSSDAFKRACTNWGIGRELYNYPRMQVKLHQNEFTIVNNKAKQTFDLKLHEWKFYIKYEDDKIVDFILKDNTHLRFRQKDGKTINNPKKL